MKGWRLLCSSHHRNRLIGTSTLKQIASLVGSMSLRFTLADIQFLLIQWKITSIHLKKASKKQCRSLPVQSTFIRAEIIGQSIRHWNILKLQKLFNQRLISLFSMRHIVNARYSHHMSPRKWSKNVARSNWMLIYHTGCSLERDSTIRKQILYSLMRSNSSHRISDKSMLESDHRIKSKLSMWLRKKKPWIGTQQDGMRYSKLRNVLEMLANS